LIGVSLGALSNEYYFRHNTRATKESHGSQVGIYGVYDPGAFYLKALGTFSWFDGDARRTVDFTGFGGTTNGAITGDADSTLLTLGLHGGYRVPLLPSTVLTPFLDFDYTSAGLHSFAERGETGAELAVDGAKDTHAFLTAGVKLATELGRLIPEVKAGYRQSFGDSRASFGAAFEGFENFGFDIVSSAEKRGALTAGLSVGGKIGRVDLRLAYEGAYNGDYTEHGGSLKLVVPLGERAAAAPAEEAAAPPPPPPPAPETQTCADGSVVLVSDACPVPPPPPPPPPPTPERG
jgi:outer membrane autotransporter protein